MRNFKRFLAMTLTMLMIVSSFSLLTSAKFEDVTDFQNEITILSNLGIIKGKADGSFGFDDDVTRRQSALFMARATTGKVDDALNWQSTVNNSPFKDLDATGDYYGAISYCANLGIVKGKTATAFAPNDNILFQEAVTMAVRALGYGTSAMDAGYPGTYYSKAISLGLDNGIEDVALNAVVSRGVMAKLLYNMMFATNAKGSTIAAEAFGAAVKSTNLVLVATSSKKLVANISVPAAAGTVAFAEFNNDGTLNLDKVYNFSWATVAALAYGEDNTEKANDKVGASFSVVTTDNFKTLAGVTENASKTFTSADAAGNGKIDGVEYSLVQKWTSVFNTGTTWTGKDELIQYNTAYTTGGITGNTAFYGNNWYVVDNANNILAKDGSILLYFMPSETGNAVFPFAYKIGGNYYPAYLPVDGSAYKGAATVDQLNAKATYDSNKNNSEITTNVNAYAETVAYDDNNDGAYDRAYFTAFTFGRYLETDTNNNGHKEYNFTIGAQDIGRITFGDNGNADVDYVLDNKSGKDLKSGDYVLWARDAVNPNIVTVKKIFSDVKTGYVTSVDVINKTLTFSNISAFGLGVGSSETVKYGVAKLPGATNTNVHANGLTSINNDGNGNTPAEELIGINYTMLHKSVSYIVDDENDGKIIAIVDEANATTPLVVTNVDYTSLLTFGNIRAHVIDQTGTAQIITISNINGIPAINYGMFGGVKDIDFDEIVFGAKQNDGTWLINTNVGMKTAPAASVLYFYNGIAYQNYNATTGVNNTIPDLASFKADGSSLVIIVENGNDYIIAKGIPANGATLSIDKDAEFYFKNGYLFVSDGDATFSGTGWNLTTAYSSGTVNDIIYIKSLGTIGGSGYTYLYPGTYFSILTGATNADLGAYITSNTYQMLRAGAFYEVTKTMQNGSVVLNAVREFTVNDFQVKYIKSFSDNHVVLVDEDGSNLNYIVGKNVTVYDWANADLGTKLGQPAAGKVYKALLYTGPATGNKMVFLVTDKAFEIADSLALTSFVGSYSAEAFNVIYSAFNGATLANEAVDVDDVVVTVYVKNDVDPEFTAPEGGCTVALFEDDTIVISGVSFDDGSSLINYDSFKVVVEVTYNEITKTITSDVFTNSTP